jgi:serine/threonine protein kinase
MVFALCADGCAAHSKPYLDLDDGTPTPPGYSPCASNKPPGTKDTSAAEGARVPEKKGLLNPGDVDDDTYEVERLLRVGGMGEGEAAEHTRLVGERVTITVLRTGRGDEALLARSRHEAAARIGHPNIVAVIDFNMLPTGEPCTVMEFLVGEPLGQRVKRGPMALAEVTLIVYQVGAALQGAHTHSAVHRDMKPDNVFLTEGDVAGERCTHVTGLDFGVSKGTRLSEGRGPGAGRPGHPLLHGSGAG